MKKALGRVEVLSGSAKFFLRVGEDGSAKYAYLEDSEVGDRDTEKCLLDAVAGASWPKPDGGDAEVRYGMELPLQATRPANDWASEKVTSALASTARRSTSARRGRAGRSARLMYVGTGEGAGCGRCDVDERCGREGGLSVGGADKDEGFAVAGELAGEG